MTRKKFDQLFMLARAVAQVAAWLDEGFTWIPHAVEIAHAIHTRWKRESVRPLQTSSGGGSSGS